MFPAVSVSAVGIVNVSSRLAWYTILNGFTIPIVKRKNKIIKKYI